MQDRHTLRRKVYRQMRDKYLVSLLPDTPHGTDTGYVYFSCRCLPCTDGLLEARKKHKAPHGTRRRYGQGCKCTACKEANTKYMRRYRKRRK